ncbi:PIR Superfamily Protein [Plasmodium ovale wallikeri]|uniref:PIR Superfamily Protein n=2 Tax=Plasmodium ovale TaxID=36330 RepID=A0A1A8YNK7_PLAOA|nr:PIR Superfamily Protein [Plasmodium ovale wallikeri]SBT58886.1 PIR Superfamily Protein [Plasmodium ovale wallikeri]SBT76216.1 PIR protein [Plasmodium ovale]
MSESEESICKTIDAGLPATDFNNKLLEAINLDSLEEYALGIKRNLNISDWYTKFRDIFISYFSDNSHNWEKTKKSKRCRDFNYYADYILDLVYHIEKKKGYDKGVVDNIKAFIDKSFVSPDHFSCKREKTEYPHERHSRKKLDDFCENRDHLIKEIKESKGECSTLDKYIYVKYNCLVSNESCIPNSKKKEENPLHISDYCTFYDISKTFPYYKCNKNYSPYHNFRISSVPFCPSYMEDAHESYEDEYENEVGNSNIAVWDILFYGSFSVLGTFFLFSFLYKFSPIGSWLRTNVIHKYKGRKNIDEYMGNSFGYDSNFMSVNAEGQHHVSYHPM